MNAGASIRKPVALAALLCLLALPAWAQGSNPAGGAAVAGAPTNRSTKNVSVVITTGNTFQTILAVQGTTDVRQALTIANNNATDSCWLFIGAATATKGTSILLLAGGSYARYWPFVPSDAIQATCANNSDTLYVDIQ